MRSRKTSDAFREKEQSLNYPNWQKLIAARPVGELVIIVSLSPRAVQRCESALMQGALITPSHAAPIRFHLISSAAREAPPQKDTVINISTRADVINYSRAAR